MLLRVLSTLAAIGLALGLSTALLESQRAEPRRVGPQPDGSTLLNSGWSLRPAGRQVPLDTFPMASRLTPDGKFAVVLNGGYNPPSLQVMDVKTEKIVSKVAMPDGWLGLAMTRDGKRLYVGGGSRASVYEFSLSEAGEVKAERTFEVTPAAGRTHEDFIGDVALDPSDRLLYAAGLFRDQVVVINPQSGRVIEKFKTGRRPYRILFHPDGQSYFVSSWAEGAVDHHEAATGQQLALLRVGPHTTDMIWRDGAPKDAEDKEAPYKSRLFVTASNTNRVYAIGLDAAKQMKLVETINVSLTPRQPLGMTPSALALSADNNTLYIVCSDANAVAVADVSEAATTVLGFVPSAWYPIAARALRDGRLLIFNGRGPRSFPNPQGPNPAERPNPLHAGQRAAQYVGRLQVGTVSIVDPFDFAKLDEYSATVRANSPYKDELLDRVAIPDGNPVPNEPGKPSPIQHVIYIVKENRTYDPVLGDLEKGNGDKSLCLFPENVSPNHHKLAREFVLFDNFYVSADVSADGHNWTTAAIAPDYVQKMWPNSYAGRRKHYDYEGGEPAARPPAGHIWTQAASAGLAMRNYGYYAENLPERAGPRQIKGVRDAALAPVTNVNYRAFDMDYPDVERAKTFIADLQQMQTMPRLMLLRLGNDHTSGTSASKIDPLSAVADNDLALGMIIEAVSKSKFWNSTAIFVLEDDAQNGPDHIDSHRSPAFIVSPYTRRGGLVDSTLYNTTSMLRTMELILGLRPMTHFDAAAPVMWQAFASQPDLKPYAAELNRIPVDKRNPANAAGARRSEAMDFTEADRIDDDELNAILWVALKGTPPPTPVRSYFAAARAR
ncbi:MAG: SMP-30/gluconolactonase/LRE family protein [Bryobacterales bacterium]|nr:SMP-30/gluconolactonase/LRE family protein [Bryobacterales bacterium]